MHIHTMSRNDTVTTTYNEMLNKKSFFLVSLPSKSKRLKRPHAGAVAKADQEQSTTLLDAVARNVKF